ncbi:MAG TPA: hypothetical protein VK629_12895 [Steroidobacteraceae bacterium]|nr:hypothetical protein [Steroidobacteraceae bacterium]
MDYRTMYDRDYIGHFDLPEGNDMTLTIKNVIAGELTAVGGRKSKKPIVHFREPVKPLICNKTNAKTIATLYGNAVEQWKGKRVTLCVSTTRDPNGGGECECIRIRPKVPAAGKEPAAAPDKDVVYITPDQVNALDARCNENGISVDWLKQKAGVDLLSMILAEDFERAQKAVTAKIEQMNLASQA